MSAMEGGGGGLEARPEMPPGGWHQPMPRPGWEGGTLASWGSRAWAWALDGLVLLVPIVALFFVFVAGAAGISGDDDFSWTAAIVGLVLWVIVVGAVTLLYAPVLMARQGRGNGQTLGKQMLGIRVVPDGGGPMTFWPAALREVVIKGLAVGFASTFIPVLPWFLDNLWPLWDDENRALHDMAASTHVVRA